MASSTAGASPTAACCMAYPRPRYWDLGDGDLRGLREFKWNNYIGRYHLRHLDLMDLLACIPAARQCAPG